MGIWVGKIEASAASTYDPEENDVVSRWVGVSIRVASGVVVMVEIDGGCCRIRVASGVVVMVEIDGGCCRSRDFIALISDFKALISMAVVSVETDPLGRLLCVVNNDVSN